MAISTSLSAVAVGAVAVVAVAVVAVAVVAVVGRPCSFGRGTEWSSGSSCHFISEASFKLPSLSSAHPRGFSNSSS